MPRAALGPSQLVQPSLAKGEDSVSAQGTAPTPAVLPKRAV